MYFLLQNGGNLNHMYVLGLVLIVSKSKLASKRSSSQNRTDVTYYPFLYNDHKSSAPIFLSSRCRPVAIINGPRSRNVQT